MEAQGMRELLASVPEDVLKSLLSATTNTLIKYGSVPLDEDGKPKMDAKTHAIDSILYYTDALGLLNRKGMKKEYLANYLSHKGIRMTMPATKSTLSRDVMVHWGMAMPENVRLIDDDPGRQPNGASSPPQRQLPFYQSNSSGNHDSRELQRPSENNLAQVEDDSMEYETAINLREQEARLGVQLGHEYSAWFYERLNTLTDFAPKHFWPECNFRLEIVFTNQQDRTHIEETFGDGEACCAKIKDLVVIKRLLFNPSFDTGIRGYMNPHGLAQVMVCGSVHNKDSGSPVGVFEQMFGLMRDPLDGNNYKIKFTCLRLREGSQLAVQNSQELLDSSLVGIVEEVD